MNIVRHGKDCITEKSAVALGNFDGLHTAHMQIINSCRDYADKKGLKSGVLLFDEHTLNLIKGQNTDLITDKISKIDILNSIGIDFVYCRKFDEAFMKMSPEEFVCDLKRCVNVSAVFVGYDYRFGYKAQGDVCKLAQLGEKYGFDVIVTDKIEMNGEAVKSSRIRELVSAGDMSKAGQMLGRMFSITGTVEKGLRNGHKLGFPTANVSYEKNTLLPCKGVYAGYTSVDGNKYKSVINVGNNPTFGAEKITVESHIQDFNEDIYGKTVTVEFAFRIREDIKFSSIDDLKNQICKDIEKAKTELI